jgi:hypothetical protein
MVGQRPTARDFGEMLIEAPLKIGFLALAFMGAVVLDPNPA